MLVVGVLYLGMTYIMWETTPTARIVCSIVNGAVSMSSKNLFLSTIFVVVLFMYARTVTRIMQASVRSVVIVIYHSV